MFRPHIYYQILELASAVCQCSHGHSSLSWGMSQSVGLKMFVCFTFILHMIDLSWLIPIMCTKNVRLVVFVNTN